MASKSGRCIRSGMCVYLVLHSDLGGQSVVSVPFLTEVEAQLLHFVLGLQVTPRLSCVSVAGAGGGKLLQDSEGGITQVKMRQEGTTKGGLHKLAAKESMLREESISFCHTVRLSLS